MNNPSQHDNYATCNHQEGPCPRCQACISQSLSSPQHTPQELLAMGYCPVCEGADDCPSWAQHQA